MQKTNQNDLYDRIAACDCAICRALISLKRDAGATIFISRKNTGRMCELAVVAAAGKDGLSGEEVVEQRAAYARHLGVELPRGTRDRPKPFHIAYAVSHSHRATLPHSSKDFIKLGQACASCVGGRYYLLWNMAVSGRSNIPAEAAASASNGGVVHWTYARAKASGDKHPFRVATSSDEEQDAENDDSDADERQRRVDEAEVDGRADLTATQKEQLIMARRGQGRFRAAVLRKEPRCRVTGIDDPAHLRASHIKAWAACDNDADRLSENNGLMLAPHVDHLFDKAYISFHDDGTLLVLKDPKMEALLEVWGIDLAALEPRPFNAAQRAFLAEHRLLLTRRQCG